MENRLHGNKDSRYKRQGQVVKVKQETQLGNKDYREETSGKR